MSCDLVSTVDRPRQRITIPTDLSDRLFEFRRALLGRQLREGVAWEIVLVLGLLMLTIFVDRVWDTPVWLRTAFATVIVVGAVLCVVRVLWSVWRSRSPLQLARTIRHRQPAFGDDLIGALELVDDDAELSRSESLCRAALDQIADKARSSNLDDALPPSNAHVAVVLGTAVSLLLSVTAVFSPPLVSSAVGRLAMPWGTFPRFTFVRLRTVPDVLVVPQGETFSRTFGLAADTRWVPKQATIDMASQRFRGPLNSQRRYRFELPAVVEASSATLKVGDTSQPFRIVPKLRPHLVDVVAEVELPAYLKGHPRFRESRQVIGEELSVVEGSQLTIVMTASSPLRGATINGRSVTVEANQLRYVVSDEEDRLRIDIVDRDGLSVERPIEVKVKRVADRRPTLMVTSEPIPPRVLDSQSLSFDLTAADDFSVRRVGMQWSAGERIGERVVGPSNGDATMLAVFQATAVKAPPGDLQVRFWVQDDHPENGRVYSDPISLTVLDADEHAVWIAEQFAKWRLAAVDVHDRELSLFQQNKVLAQTDAAQRDAGWRARVAQQARAEQFNARQLEALTREGESLMRQAARNDQVDAESVERLAGTLQTLQQLADEKMPAVADLLNQASEEESKFAAMQDQESSQGVLEEQKAMDADAEPETSDDAKRERVGLAQTTIVDTSKRNGNQKDGADGDADKLTLAIDDQAELISDFDAVAEQLQSLLGNMEDSTLVKRLKSVSRLQDRVAKRLAQSVGSTFGQTADDNREDVHAVAVDIADTSQRVRTVLDDLEALCERRNIEHFADVLAEMKDARVLDALKHLEKQVAAKPAMSIAAAEFWADTLDRWADDLIDPRSGESQEKSGPKKSLSPEVVLEVLRILESEVDLRKQTRVAEQGRAVTRTDDYMGEAVRLSQSQDLLRDRLDVVVQGLEAAPDGALNYSAEIEVLSAASAAMVDATKTLVQPETGPPAIAAQTEAIELLLQSNKVMPSDSAGGGGAGAGAGGEADQAAVAMLGEAINGLANPRQSDPGVATSNGRERVPERFREGVTEYFDRLERRLSAEDSKNP